jgi:uncharacterized protein (TIGR00725 family)
MSSPRRADGRRRAYVAVVGGSRVDDATTSAAVQVGRLLAEAGAVVVTGGRTGVAEAASHGAQLAGGDTLGLLPGRRRSEGNPWLTLVVTTGLGDTRNALVAMNGDVVIALDGEQGTMSEIAHALIDGTPVITLGAWELADLSDTTPPVVRAASPEEAVAAALRALDRPGSSA